MPSSWLGIAEGDILDEVCSFGISMRTHKAPGGLIRPLSLASAVCSIRLLLEYPFAVRYTMKISASWQLVLLEVGRLEDTLLESSGS